MIPDRLVEQYWSYPLFFQKVPMNSRTKDLKTIRAIYALLFALYPAWAYADNWAGGWGGCHCRSSCPILC